MKHILISAVLIALMLCSCRNSATRMVSSSDVTAEMAYEGVNNYCHSKYDWSVAEKDASMMYVAIEDETETEYKVIFRSYTGTYVYFFVDKASGATRMVEYVPALGVESEAGTINLLDYLDKDD